MNISNDIDSYLRKRKVTTDTKITLALLIELLDGFFKEKSDNSDGWISVEDSLPERKTQQLLLLTDFDGITVGWWALFSTPPEHKKNKYQFRVYQPFTLEVKDHKIKISHWQPLPSPPKK